MIAAFNKKLSDFDDLVLFDSQYIGKATIPWSLFTYESIIYGKNDHPLFLIQGSRFQAQTCFYTLPVGPFEEAVFNIYLFEDQKKPVGYVFRRWQGLFQNFCANAPQYIIEYPHGMDWSLKLLVIAAV